MWRAILLGTAIVAGITAWQLRALQLDALQLSAWNPATWNLSNTFFAGATSEAKPAAPATTNAKAGRAVAVEAIEAEAATTSEDIRALGSLQSDESVQISSEIAGRITEIPLVEGAAVAAGDILVKLDDALARAEVTDTEARFEFASGNLGRANTLAKSGNVTERARDEATTNAEIARAALELAKVRLAKHTMRAPFPGTAGLRKISPGAYVAAGQPIINLEKIDTLKIDFKVPELFLSNIKTGQQVSIEVDALPGRKFPATIYAIDPHIDVNGRALSIRARLENTERILRPGLFARIEIKGLTQRNVVLVPESAIVPRGSSKVVYVIKDGKVAETIVALAARSNGMVEVVSGLAPGTRVVTAGQQKLKNGSVVEVVASATPAAKGS
ncbi:MAG: efflux RND transporter periplasmic adaptor subunit [Hyphomicrobium sp.]|jgi:membrane fusion protein (multidrug efflux system)